MTGPNCSAGAGATRCGQWCGQRRRQWLCGTERGWQLHWFRAGCPVAAPPTGCLPDRAQAPARRRLLATFGHPDDHLARIGDRRRCRPAHGGLCLRRRGLVGKRRVERRRRNAFCRFRSTDDDPVACRILYEVGGVAGRDHAEVAGGLGEGGCGLGLEHVALEGFLLLQQRLIGLPGAAELIRPLGGVRRQPQRDAEAQPERSDDQHDERDPRCECARVEFDLRDPGKEPLSQGWPDNLGRLGFPRLRPGLGLAGVFRPDGLDLRPGDRRGIGRARPPPPRWCVG